MIWTDNIGGIGRALKIHKQRVAGKDFNQAFQIKMYWNVTDDFKAGVHQKLTELPDGLYCLKAKVRKQGAFFKAAHIYANANEAHRAVIPHSLEFQTVFIRDIEVTNGEATIGIDVDAFGAMWPVPSIFMDDVEFFLQSEAK